MFDILCVVFLTQKSQNYVKRKATLSFSRRNRRIMGIAKRQKNCVRQVLRVLRILREKYIFLRENDKLICLIGKFTLLLQCQTFKNLYVMKKNYLFPHYFQWIGLAIAVISFVALCVGPNMDFSIRMPALYNGDISFDEESNSGFFRMADTGMFSIAMPLLIIGLIFLGFSKEKVEDEFVQYLRSQSLIWSTYVTAGLFILGTLLIYGLTYLLIPYMVFFVFLLLFILKFKIALHHYNKGGAQ